MSKFKSEPARPSVSSRLQLLVWFLAVSAHWLLATSASSIMPPDAYLTSGTKLQEDGKLEQAAHHFRAAMRSLPSKEGGWLAAFNLGRVLNDLGRPEEAQQALERALTGARQAKRSEGEIGSIWYNLGVVLEDVKGEGGGPEKAAEAYQTAGECGITLAWYNLGCLRERQTDGAHLSLEALTCFAKAVGLDPSLHVAWSNAGSLLRRNASYEAAGRAFGHALTAAAAEAHNSTSTTTTTSASAGAAASQYFLNLAQVFARQGVSPWQPPSSPGPPAAEAPLPDYGRARKCAEAALAWDPSNDVAAFMQQAYLSEEATGGGGGGGGGGGREGGGGGGGGGGGREAEERWWAERSPAVGTETTQPPQPPRMPSRAPRGFLQAIFDQEAKEAKAPGDDAMATITVFDQKLRDELAYDAPEALRAAVDKVLAGRGETSTLPPFRHGLDLGCGTGSNGPLWRGLVSGAWVGVDVSRGMALAAWQRAKRKDKSSSPHSYDRVFEADIDDVFSAAPPAEEATGDSALLLLLLRNLEEREDDDDGGAAVTPSASESAALAAESSWGVVTATDTLIYVGDLRATFAAVSSRLAAPGGIFAVSLERFDDSDSESGWRLQGSGTYAHSKRHVMEAAEAAGLRVEHYDDAHSPRLERGAPVKGHLAIFSKP